MDHTPDTFHVVDACRGHWRARFKLFKRVHGIRFPVFLTDSGLLTARAGPDSQSSRQLAAAFRQLFAESFQGALDNALIALHGIAGFDGRE